MPEDRAACELLTFKLSSVRTHASAFGSRFSSWNAMTNGSQLILCECEFLSYTVEKYQLTLLKVTKVS